MNLTPNRLHYRCPNCLEAQVELKTIAESGWTCPRCEEPTNSIGGIPNGLTAEREDYFNKFCRDYEKLLDAHDYATDDLEHYRSLPNIQQTRRATEWSVKAQSFRYFERRILRRLAADATRPQRILDVGAGNGWLCNRLCESGHEPTAVDLLTNARHGLGARRHYESDFACVRGEMEALPLADGQFDVVAFNESFHFAVDYWRTLQEARRCLQWGGRVVIIDTPIFERWQDGEAWERSRHDRIDAVPSMGYLSTGMLEDLARDLNIEWNLHRPWYGVADYLRRAGPVKRIIEASWPTAVA